MENSSLSLVVSLLTLLGLVLSTVLPRILPRIEKRRVEAAEKSSLAEAAEKAGRTLSDAFEEIDNLKRQIQELESELRRWRNYSFRLQKQIIEDHKGTPLPFDTKPPQKRVAQ